MAASNGMYPVRGYHEGDLLEHSHEGRRTPRGPREWLTQQILPDRSPVVSPLPGPPGGSSSGLDIGIYTPEDNAKEWEALDEKHKVQWKALDEKHKPREFSPDWSRRPEQFRSGDRPRITYQGYPRTLTPGVTGGVITKYDESHVTKHPWETNLEDLREGREDAIRRRQERMIENRADAAGVYPPITQQENALRYKMMNKYGLTSDEAWSEVNEGRRGRLGTWHGLSDGAGVITGPAMDEGQGQYFRDRNRESEEERILRLEAQNPSSSYIDAVRDEERLRSLADVEPSVKSDEQRIRELLEEAEYWRQNKGFIEEGRSRGMKGYHEGGAVHPHLEDGVTHSWPEGETVERMAELVAREEGELARRRAAEEGELEEGSYLDQYTNWVGKNPVPRTIASAAMALPPTLMAAGAAGRGIASAARTVPPAARYVGDVWRGAKSHVGRRFTNDPILRHLFKKAPAFSTEGVTSLEGARRAAAAHDAATAAHASKIGGRVIKGLPIMGGGAVMGISEALSPDPTQQGPSVLSMVPEVPGGTDVVDNADQGYANLDLGDEYEKVINADLFHPLSAPTTAAAAKRQQTEPQQGEIPHWGGAGPPSVDREVGAAESELARYNDILADFSSSNQSNAYNTAGWFAAAAQYLKAGKPGQARNFWTDTGDALGAAAPVIFKGKQEQADRALSAAERGARIAGRQVAENISRHQDAKIRWEDRQERSRRFTSDALRADARDARAAARDEADRVHRANTFAANKAHREGQVAARDADTLYRQGGDRFKFMTEMRESLADDVNLKKRHTSFLGNVNEETYAAEINDKLRALMNRWDRAHGLDTALRLNTKN